MAKDFDVKWRFGLIDKLAGPAKRLAGAFKPITKSAKRANVQFQLMQRNTKKLRNNLTKVGKGIQGAGKTMAIGLTAPIAAFGIATIKTAITFEQSMNAIAAKTGATGKSLQSMRNLAKKLGSETQFSASQAADAMAFLGQAGFKTNQILAATPAILDLAAASGSELGRAADIASNIMGGFGLKAKDMTRIADVLAATTASANVDLEMMAEGMKSAAPVAKMFGLSIEETSAAVGLLGNVGIQGSLAGNTMKNMMLNLTAPASGAKKLIQALGVEVVKSDGSMRGLTSILADLGPALSKIPKAKQLAVLNEIFGKRAIAGAGELVTQALKVGKDGVNAIERYTNSLRGLDGKAKEMAKTMNRGAPGAVKALASSFEGLQIAIAESGVLDMFTSVANGITSVFRKISQVNPAFLKTVSIIAMVVAVIGPLVLIFGTIIAMLPAVITGWAALQVALFGVSVAGWAALLPFIKFIAVAALFTAAAFMIMKAWEPIKAFFADLFTNPLQQMIDMIGFAGNLTRKLAGFLGLTKGNSKEDEALEKRGFTISDGPKGKPLGAEKVIKQSNDFKVRQSKAAVAVNFANLPKGATVETSKDVDSIIGLNIGAMGAI